KGEDGALHPADEDSEGHLKRFKRGAIFEAEVTMKRNGKHHRLGMLMLRMVFDNQSRIGDFESFLIEVKILTGCVDIHIAQGGAVYYIPRSINFQAMDELAFSKWKDQAMTAVFEHFIPGMPKAEQDRVINNLLARL